MAPDPAHEFECQAQEINIVSRCQQVQSRLHPFDVAQIF